MNDLLRKIAGTFVLASTFGLVACGGSGESSAAAPPPAERIACAALVNREIPASEIGLPTRGAQVATAAVVPASGAGASTIPEHCLVSGRIAANDPTAPDILFRVAMPTTWNTKAVMTGGGGYNGFLPNFNARATNSTATEMTPLARGYATFGSDGGTPRSPSSPPGIDGSALASEEAYRNWTGESLKKTRDVAMNLIKATYGQLPTRSYFLGKSTGGKEALVVAGRWPKDWDGIVSHWPARNVVPLILHFAHTSQGFSAPGALPNAAKRNVLFQAALQACDGLDGAVDGIISSVQRCNSIFDPATATLSGAPVRCAGGADLGDTCLSDQQIAALRRMNDELVFNFSLASGDSRFPGFNAFISDTGRDPSSPLFNTVNAYGIGAVAPQFPVTAAMSYSAGFADGFFRFAVTHDPGFNYLTLDSQNPGAYVSRLSYLSALDTGDRDLTAFANRGGKAMLLHGTEDLLISPRSTQMYYQRLQTVMGVSAVDSFMRYYEVPGMGHTGVATTFNMAWDQLAALEDWVERGIDPGNNLVASDTAGVPGRTRPLCQYPTFPRYKGTGDINSAASFRCANS